MYTSCGVPSTIIKGMIKFTFLCMERKCTMTSLLRGIGSTYTKWHYCGMFRSKEIDASYIIHWLKNTLTYWHRKNRHQSSNSNPGRECSLQPFAVLQILIRLLEVKHIQLLWIFKVEPKRISYHMVQNALKVQSRTWGVKKPDFFMYRHSHGEIFVFQTWCPQKFWYFLH